MVTVENQIERLERAVERLLTAVASLGDDVFLSPVDGGSGWSPRDIVAHLIGWNRQVIEGGRQIARGELPFYDVDPGEDYSKINAALVRRYAWRDREALGRELQASAGDLRAFLLTLDARVWASDHGVRHGATIVTIQNTVDEVIADYDHHRAQLETL